MVISHSYVSLPEGSFWFTSVGILSFLHLCTIGTLDVFLGVWFLYISLARSDYQCSSYRRDIYIYWTTNIDLQTLKTSTFWYLLGPCLTIFRAMLKHALFCVFTMCSIHCDKTGWVSKMWLSRMYVVFTLIAYWPKWNCSHVHIQCWLLFSSMP